MNYLCDDHYFSLPGEVVEWTAPLMGTEKCIVCGNKAEHEVSLLTLTGNDLSRYIVCINNEPSRAKNIWQNGVWEFEEDEYLHFCSQCHFPLTHVRMGKYQCETPWCPSNQKEE